MQDGPFCSGTPLPERIDGRRESLPRWNGPVAAAAGSARGRFVMAWFLGSCGGHEREEQVRWKREGGCESGSRVRAGPGRPGGQPDPAVLARSGRIALFARLGAWLDPAVLARSGQARPAPVRPG